MSEYFDQGASDPAPKPEIPDTIGEIPDFENPS